MSEDTRPQRDFPVGEAEEGSRLETFLQKALGYSRATALKAIRKGWVRVEGSRAKGGRRLGRDETVRITNYALLPPPGLDQPAPAPSGRSLSPSLRRAAEESIRHQTTDWLVSCKPAGEVVHAGSGHGRGWIDSLGVVLEGRVTPVGRLDRDTSGLLVLSRTRLGARRLFASLKDGSLQRVYTTLVAGHPPPEGRIELALAKRGPAGEERMEPDPEGLPARTRFRVLARGPRESLLAVEIETGRTHQIRAHLRAKGHPILGDPRYATPGARQRARALGLDRLFLHAGELRVPPPEGGEVLTFQEPLPPELQRCVDKAGVE